MRTVIQRVKRASVSIKGQVKAEIGSGVLILIAIGQEDDQAQAEALAQQVSQLRIMADGQGKMNLSLLDTGGEALVVSQFTLYADTSKGRRPSFRKAAQPDKAEKIYNSFIRALLKTGVEVKTGQFAAYMEVSLVNDGPVTLILDR